ncbi:unnamed protein product [Urochloa humidicola]
MASVPSRPLCWFLLACVISCFSLIPCCTSDGGAAAAGFHVEKKDATDIVGRALICFNDRYIYSGCQESFRLGPQGSLGVPPGSADAFCGGPCLAETELVLRCVDAIMGNFRFYNGAAAADVRAALDRGCGRSALRGDFDVLRRLGGGGYGDGVFYGRGASLVGGLALTPLRMLGAAAAILLVWATCRLCCVLLDSLIVPVVCSSTSYFCLEISVFNLGAFYTKLLSGQVARSIVRNKRTTNIISY